MIPFLMQCQIILEARDKMTLVTIVRFEAVIGNHVVLQ